MGRFVSRGEGSVNQIRRLYRVFFWGLLSRGAFFRGAFVTGSFFLGAFVVGLFPRTIMAQLDDWVRSASERNAESFDGRRERSGDADWVPPSGRRTTGRWSIGRQIGRQAI